MDIEPITIKLDRPEDLLAYLPYRFGYVPTESLAILTVLEPAPGAVAPGLAARLDIADIARPGALAGAASGIGAQMRQDPTVAALTVVYTDEPLQDVRAGRGAAGRALEEWLAVMPFTHRTASFVVSTNAFACLECAGAPCCPDEGHPISRLSTTAITARMVLAGEVLAPSREALGCSREIDAHRLAVATRAADRERRAMRTRAMSPRAADLQARWRRRMLDLYGVALAEAGTLRGPWWPDATGPGRLGVALADPHLRDAILAWTISGERGQPGSPAVMNAFRDMVTGGLEPPAPAHVQACRVVLGEIVRHAAPGRAGYALAVRGWLAWWCGEGARAEVLVRQCLEEHPGCTLGELLEDALVGGVRPGWALPHACVAPGGF